MIKCHKILASIMLNGEALGTIPIKTGNLTRIPAAATITLHCDERTVQHSVAENEKRAHEYLMRTKSSLFADDIVSTGKIQRNSTENILELM